MVVATGGLSIPKLGATGFGYEVARGFGLRVVETRPGLVPLLLGAGDREAWCDLSGVSAAVTARVSAGRGGSAGGPGKRRGEAPAFQEKMLLTHRGLSGPAILQISSYWRDSSADAEGIEIDPSAGQDVFAPLLGGDGRRDAAGALAALRDALPARWAERWLAAHLPRDAPRQLPNRTLLELEDRLHHWRLVPAGTEGFEKAEVTAGGVDTAELDARTLQCYKVPGLFFVGEVVDVTGWLGGYNFQWAWASGVCAGGRGVIGDPASEPGRYCTVRLRLTER